MKSYVAIVPAMANIPVCVALVEELILVFHVRAWGKAHALYAAGQECNSVELEEPIYVTHAVALAEGLAYLVQD